MLNKMAYLVALCSACATLGGCGIGSGSANPRETIDFERPVKFIFSDNATAWTILKGTRALWEEAAEEAPLLFNDHPNMALPPLIARVLIADTEDTWPGRAEKNCKELKYQAYTPYGLPETYICALNKFDEPPYVGSTPEEIRRDPWRGQWQRKAFLAHEAGGHGFAGAQHTPKGVPAILCGWPDDDPNLCYAMLTGFTKADKESMCSDRVTGGFCVRTIPPQP